MNDSNGPVGRQQDLPRAHSLETFSAGCNPLPRRNLHRHFCERSGKVVEPRVERAGDRH